MLQAAECLHPPQLHRVEEDLRRWRTSGLQEVEEDFRRRWRTSGGGGLQDFRRWRTSGGGGLQEVEDFRGWRTSGGGGLWVESMDRKDDAQTPMAPSARVNNAPEHTRDYRSDYRSHPDVSVLHGPPPTKVLGLNPEDLNCSRLE